MTLVIDASVALKFVYREPGTAEALGLLDRDDQRIAPAWIIAEVANALTNKMRFEGAPADRMRSALQALPEFIDRLLPIEPMLEQAMELAARLGHAFYDCLYLAAALEEDGRVVTADDGFVAAARRAGYADRVERLRW